MSNFKASKSAFPPKDLNSIFSAWHKGALPSIHPSPHVATDSLNVANGSHLTTKKVEFTSMIGLITT
jgi:hypothetical protein